jgi:hypothetical protein
MSEKYIYVKLLKPWGGFLAGDVVRFGQNKGQGRIDLGIGIKVPKQKAVNDPKLPSKQKKAETTMQKPAAENTDARPDIQETRPDNVPPEIMDAQPERVVDMDMPAKDKNVKEKNGDKGKSKKGK